LLSRSLSSSISATPRLLVGSSLTFIAARLSCFALASIPVSSVTTTTCREWDHNLGAERLDLEWNIDGVLFTQDARLISISSSCNEPKISCLQPRRG